MTGKLNLTKKDFVSDQEVRWCPGCADFAILSTVQKVMPELDVPRDQPLGHELLRSLRSGGHYPLEAGDHQIVAVR